MTAGCLFIISAPSGAGKTSLVKALLKKDAQLKLSVSFTSRPRRSLEVDGHDYHFVSEETFKTLQAQNEFLESAEIYGNFYGTSKQWIHETIAAGQDILLEIDGQGARQVRNFFSQAVSIFVLPPSGEVLKQRLISRDQDDADVIQKRLHAMHEEVSHINEFDYVIINDELETALNCLASIINAERLKSVRQIEKHRTLISQLTSG